LIRDTNSFKNLSACTFVQTRAFGSTPITLRGAAVVLPAASRHEQATHAGLGTLGWRYA